MAYLIESVFSMWEHTVETQDRPDKYFLQVKKDNLLRIMPFRQKAGIQMKKPPRDWVTKWLYE
jgi:hypothetical protein